MQNCSDNAFCASLPEKLRSDLCKKCIRRITKAGSFQLYRDFERHATLILDGALMSSIYVGDDVLDFSDDTPAFYLGLPGRILATNVTFRDTKKAYYGDNGVEYLTDCCIATFEHDFFREMFYSNSDFAHSLVLSMLRIMEDACEVSAILRAPTVLAATHHLILYLSFFDVYLTQQQIANITNHDRASISKAIKQIKKQNPELAQNYISNKGRKIEMLEPF